MVFSWMRAARSTRQELRPIRRIQSFLKGVGWLPFVEQRLLLLKSLRSKAIAAKRVRLPSIV